MNTEETPALPPENEVDTNVEYISASGIETQPPIITSVFKSIFIETPKEVYLSIKYFFMRYTTLFSDAYKYLNSPSLKIKPFSTKDYKESCQHTFELILIITGVIIFLIKMDWIPADAKQAEGYNNDVIQTIFQVIFFIIYALVYSILVVLAVVSGRIYRYLFKIQITRQEGDILFTYLNNSLFIITLIITFFMRCFIKADTVKESDSFAVIVFLLYIVGFAFLVARWAKRFAELNNVPVAKKMFFRICITITTSLFLGIISAMINFLIIGI